MRFIVVDDNKVFRESIVYFIENVLKQEVVATFENGKEVLESSHIYQADIVIMDVEMPELNGIESTKKLLWLNNFLKIIAVTAYKDKAYLFELVHAGFKACIFKDAVFDELECAIDKVSNNSIYFPKELKIDNN